MATKNITATKKPTCHFENINQERKENAYKHQVA